MLVYCEKISPRIEYTIKYIFKDRLGLKYELTSNLKRFRNFKSAKINYSGLDISNCVQIIPEGLLNELSIRKAIPNVVKTKDYILLFPDDNPNSIGFDLFSACFWFLSRYEEYQEFNPDKYDRFPATESFAYKKNFLHKPVVDEWIVFLKNKLKEEYPVLLFQEENYKVIPTFDVDSPWCYKHKGFMRNAGGFIRDLLKAEFNYIKLRKDVLTNKVNDPWYQFDWILKELEYLNLKGVFFIHVGDYGKYDKTVNFKLKQFSEFVSVLKGNLIIGLHPSFKASNNRSVFKNEINRLEEISHKKIIRSRQHFLKFRVPSYYNMLESLEIHSDYSLGFADMPGFRAGTSKPFLFYDLHEERSSKVKIHPFCIMDRTLKTYQKLSKQDALRIFEEFAVNLKKVNGTFVSLWHNETFSDNFEWKGWKQLFKDLMAQVAK